MSKLKLTKEEKHQILRENFWCKVYVSLVKKHGEFICDHADKADRALEEFDKRFSNEQIKMQQLE